MARHLTYLQKRFIQAYPQCYGNGAEAARRAGYSPRIAKQVAHELLKKNKVQTALRMQSNEEYSAAKDIAQAINKLLQSSKTSDISQGVNLWIKTHKL